ncbi:MAG: hypothetical protein R3349_10010 [Geminicoccaceae bacterium]|nr:hypothetical protein [Geminicoccaceae bacterium]
MSRFVLSALAALAAGSLEARPITLEGLTFSDELGGVELIEGWGTGTIDDPFVLVEVITGTGPATLVVRGATWRFGNRIRSHHEIGFALTKIVENRTELPWPVFNLELREFQDQSSPFGDGLSFGQATEAGRPFTSDRYVMNQDIGEPYDGLLFYDGMIMPGDQVALSFVITDTTPKWEFFLMQRRDSPLAMLP